MPYIVNNSNINLSGFELTIDDILKHKKITFISDCEYTQKKKMIVDCVGIYSPQLMPDKAIVYLDDDLDDNFHPVINALNTLGLKTLIPEYISELETEIGELEFEIFDDAPNPKKAFEQAIKDGIFDNFLAKYNLSVDNLYYKRDSKNKESKILIKLPQLKVELGFFFAFADFFKIFGKNHQDWLLNTARISNYRVMKLMGNNDNKCIYLEIENKLFEVQITLRDYMFRFPPRQKGLDAQAKTFGLNTQKVDIETEEYAIELGLEREQIKQNMSLFKAKFLDEFIKYNALDLFTTAELDIIQRELLHLLRSNFSLDDVEIADTTGSNVARFITDLIDKAFNNSSDSKERKQNESIIKNQLNLTRIDNLENIELNDFGYQPFLTVGGLLFTRMCNHPYLEGRFSDLDLKSCYATAMSDLMIYLGEPKVVTFKYKNKPKLRQVAEFIEKKKIPKDACFIRVSGMLNKAYNTLVPSDLRYKPIKLKNPELIPYNTDVQSSAIVAKNPSRYGINENKKQLGGFNNEKIGKKLAISTILLKEIKFGLINYDILESIKLMPDEWVEEYLDLEVNAFVYYAPELIVDSLEELEEKRATLPDEPILQKFDFDKEINIHTSQNYKNNVALRFNISEIWEELKNNRNKYKKEKNPVQEVLKLFQNSGYGVLACLYLTTNNLMASNQITAQARVGAWMMVNALNGCAPITDGTAFCWDSIPLSKTFKGILKDNPEYVFNYDDTIKSRLELPENRQYWIDSELKKHLSKYFQITEDHHLIKKFDYELKTEYYKTKDNQSVETDLFTIYINSNAGNYIKGMLETKLLLDETEYDFNHQTDYLKARSYQSNEGLIEWYSKSLKEGYNLPHIYSENTIIKFSDGTQKALQFLKECERIVHPMGFGTKAFKMMKLISRSQFLFLNESQLRNFETNEAKLAELSKTFANRTFWQNYQNNEKNINENYWEYSKTHSTGIGFEILALMKKHKGSVQSVRQMIQEKILEGCKDFNAGLHLDRNIQSLLNNELKDILASVIILKKNADTELKNTLLNSLDEPTLLVVSRENITTLEQIWTGEDE